MYTKFQMEHTMSKAQTITEKKDLRLAAVIFWSTFLIAFYKYYCLIYLKVVN